MEEHLSPADAGGTDREGRARAMLLAETERRGSLAEVDLEALCAAHPALAQELRRLHVGCTQLDAMLDRLRHGLHQEPLEDLATAPGSASRSGGDGSAALELVRRLLRQPPVSERYSVVAERGRGAMGSVFDVWDEDLRRPLAMKVARKKELAAPFSKRGSTGLARSCR